MTPRTVVFSLPPEETIEDLLRTKTQLNFSRIPLYNVHESTISGVVLRRDIMNKIAQKETSHKLESMARPPEFVIETMSIYRLLNLLISHKTHLAIVLNEYGDFIGVVSMEDAIETLLGREIVDEFDPAVDMRELALKKRFRFFKKKP
ncbi:MAG: CBS domain-containing protein [Deltaproteobacteria bacterium]|nr:CBS domain-containing protein [Deltaproteobacteria bacterium]